MWIDERGSEVLPLAECRRLLALAAKRRHHGHLGFPTDDAPVVLPLDFSVHGSDVVLQLGDGLFAHVVGRLVAFQVDHTAAAPDDDSEGRWSVLVRGLALEGDPESNGHDLPEPRVAEPGLRIVHVRADVVTGRRIHGSHASSGGTER